MERDVFPDDIGPDDDLTDSLDEYYTPLKFILAVRAVFGGVIDLDPASCEAAQETVRALRYYSKEMDGLKRKWRGRIFLNPPYSKPLLSKFINKLVHDYRSGYVTEAILLVNNYTENICFQNACKVATAFCFVDGRIKFRNGYGIPEGIGKRGSVFLYFGDRPEVFAEHFAKFGLILLPGKF